MTDIPEITVTVLYPLRFAPGVDEGWKETVSDCLTIAMARLFDKIVERGLDPAQGRVIGPHDLVAGSKVPLALGWEPDSGEPVPPPKQHKGESLPQGVPMRAYEFWGVFMQDDEGKPVPCTTLKRGALLAFTDGPSAIEVASRRYDADARVHKCWLTWEEEPYE